MSGFVKLGTKKPTINQKEDNKINKWSNGIAQQYNKQSTPLNIQRAPLSQVKIDPNNMRSFTITFDEIKGGPKLKLDQSPEEIDFINLVKEYFSKTPSSFFIQKVNEYLKLAELAHSIGEPNKLINPVTAYLDGMEFQLIAGHRRTFAHFILDAEDIAINIIPKPTTQLEHFMVQWKENEAREDLSLSEKLISINRTIDAWEKENKERMSITKLMSLLHFKKTSAYWYLTTTRAYSNDALFKQLIDSNKLNSLEIAFNISNIKDHEEKKKQINALLSEKEIAFTKTVEKLAKEKSAVRTPNSEFSLKEIGFKVSNSTNRKFIKKVITLLVSSPVLSEVSQQINKLNLSSKKGLTEAWLTIYKAIGSNDNE